MSVHYIRFEHFLFEHFVFSVTKCFLGETEQTKITKLNKYIIVIDQNNRDYDFP